MAVDSVTKNGILVDYNPPSGINSVTEIIFDTVAVNYSAGATVAVPQGDSGGVLNTPAGSISDRIWDGRDAFNVALTVDGAGNPVVARASDAGFGTTVKATGGNKWFTANAVCRGTSGSSAPTGAQVDGSLRWSSPVTWLGSWPAATAVSTGQYITDLSGFDGVTYVYNCIGAGTTDATRPNAPGFDTSSIGQITIAEVGGVFWQRRGIYRGAWAGTTSYGFVVLSDQIQVHRDYVSYPADSTKLLPFNEGVVAAGNGTFQTAGTEPAWSAAADNTRWISGNVVWAAGSDLFPGDADTHTKEQLVLTGLLAPSGAKTLRITNNSTGGTARQVVLADHASMTDPDNFDTFVRVTTDADSAAGNRFNFGGRFKDIYLQPGVSVDIVYNAGAAEWQLPSAAAAAVRIAPRITHF